MQEFHTGFSARENSAQENTAQPVEAGCALKYCFILKYYLILYQSLPVFTSARRGTFS